MSDYICLLGGHRPPSIAGKFSYCEIGCGNGVTLNGLAQIYPDADFTGIDADAGLIENAGALASAAGLENTRFLEMDVAEIGDAKLPGFDYIVIGDIYSAVDRRARNGLREFIGAKLKSGGVLFVGYHALPGWSAIARLRDLVLQHTAPMTSDAVTKAQSGLDYLGLLREKKAGFFADNPPLSTFLDGLMERDIKAVAHELFSAPVKPYYFHQVTAEMRSAGMTYSGSALLNLNFVDIAVPAEFHDLLRKSATRIEFETHGDYIRNQRFRKDVFIKDDPTLDEQERDAMLAEIPFGIICNADEFNREVRFGEVHLKYIALKIRVTLKAVLHKQLAECPAPSLTEYPQRQADHHETQHRSDSHHPCGQPSAAG
ncbi:MAG: methyltransferase regulatory domain-containing protein [Rhodospirillales bacterium]|nr:methyltransferase regulatory domain-containing protein [Rhodospirillales bacterium]